MSQTYYSEAHINALKQEIQEKITKALIAKGHVFGENSMHTVDGVYLDYRIQTWGERSYSAYGHKNGEYAQAVEVTVFRSSGRRSCNTSRRSKKGVFTDEDLNIIVGEMEDIIANKKASEQYQADSKVKKQNTIQFLTGLGVEISYDDCYIGQKYHSDEGTIKVSDSGSMAVTIPCGNDQEKAKKIIEFVRELNKIDESEAA